MSNTAPNGRDGNDDSINNHIQHTAIDGLAIIIMPNINNFRSFTDATLFYYTYICIICACMSRASARGRCIVVFNVRMLQLMIIHKRYVCIGYDVVYVNIIIQNGHDPIDWMAL